MHRPTAGRTDGPSIRHARLRDIAAIRDLAHSAARVLCAPDYTPRQVETALRFGLGPDLQMIVDGTYYVVEYDGRLTAAGGWSCRAALMGNLHPDYAGGPRDLLDPAAHPARLRAFFVRPDVARRGLGRALVGLCELAASRAGFTQIELLATPPGRRLCLACGFDDVEPMTNVFPDGVAVPAFRMAKALHPLGPDDEPARRRCRAYGSALSLN